MIVHHIQCDNRRDIFIEFKIQTTAVVDIYSLGVLQIIAKEIDLIHKIDIFKNFDFIYDFLFLVILNPPFLNIKFKPWYNTKVNSFLSIS